MDTQLMIIAYNRILNNQGSEATLEFVNTDESHPYNAWQGEKTIHKTTKKECLQIDMTI